GHSERMPKRHQAGTAPPISRLESQALAQPSKPVMQGQIPQGLPRLRSWRRPLPPASVRRKNTSWSKDQGVQCLRRWSLQRLYKFILDHDKISHSYNYLIFLLFL